MVTDDIDLIASSITLPNGVVVPNRLVKVSPSPLKSESYLVVQLTMSLS